MQSGAVFIYSVNEEDKRENERERERESGRDGWRDGGRGARQERLVAIGKEVTSA